MKSRVDLLVALGLLVTGQVEIALSGVDGSEPLAHVYWGLVALSSLIRRSHPLVFAFVCVGGLVPVAWLELVPQWSVIFPVAAPLSVFGLGLYGKRTVPAAVSAVAFALAAVLIVWLNQYTGEAGHDYLAFEWVRLVTIYLGAAGAGILLRDRTDALEAARAAFASLPPAETEVEAAVSDSRQRIAREVHGVVRRCLDRAQGAIEEAQRSLGSAPAIARGAVGRARASSREAMDEMRRMLGLLREDPDARAVSPVEPAPPENRVHRILLLASDQALFLLALLNGILSAIFTWNDAALIGGDLALGWRLAGATLTAALFIPRRRWPLVTVIGVPVALFVRVFLFDDRLPFDFFVWSAVFVAGAYLRPLPLAAGGGLFVLAASMGTAWLVEPETPWQAFAAASATTFVVWLVGLTCRERVDQRFGLEEAEREERDRRADAARRAIREQKLAVARELHDVVGHSLTAMTLQCAGVERLIPRDLDGAAEVLATIEGLGREASRELSDLYVALSGYRSPVLPRLEALPALAERTRSLGTEVELVTSGDLSSVPVGPGAAAYRIVQESLNNAGKHSGGPVNALVELRGDRIRMLIENPSSGASAEGFSLGLVGVRERAEAYGGRVEAGPDGRGAWRVQAEVPLSPTTTSPPS